MTCREATDFLGEYVSGALAPEVRATFDGHLDRCPNCREFVSQYQRVVEAGRTAFDDEGALAVSAMPEELVRAILASLPRDPAAG